MKAIFLIIVLSISSQTIAREVLLDLTTPSSGVVQKIFVKAGDTVKKGKVLLALDQRVFKASMAQAIADVKSAKLALEEAKRQLARTEDLYEQTLISDRELQLANIDFAKFESLLKQAEKAKVKAQYELDYSQLLAPFSGKIKSVPAFPGMVVNNQIKNTVLITMSK